MDVPNGRPASSTRAIFPPLISTTVPASSSAALVSSRRRETDAIDGSASPRNPSVATLSRSSVFLIFDVAWRSKASMASSRTMPQPLSVIWMSFFPPASTLILMRVAPASREFSSISFTTAAGRSTTSPAAIWFATVSESTWILPMSRDPSLLSGFRLRAPASLTPAKRLNFSSGNLVRDGFGENVDAAHGQ